MATFLIGVSILIITAVILVSSLRKGIQCPECGREMEQVPGWYKLECKRCGKTINKPHSWT